MPQKVVSRFFQKTFLARLLAFWENQKLNFPPDQQHLADRQKFLVFYQDLLKNKSWVVKIMPPMSNPQRVIDYLGRYVYRVAITESRIAEVKNEEAKVIFKYKDYASQSADNLPVAEKTMTLDVQEFIRRFAQHILPPGFQKVRYNGIYATACRKKILPEIRKNIGNRNWAITIRTLRQILQKMLGFDPDCCPACGAKTLEVTLLHAFYETISIQKNQNQTIRPPPKYQPEISATLF